MSVQSGDAPSYVKNVTNTPNLGQGCQSEHLTGLLKSLTLDDSYTKNNEGDTDEEDDDDDDDYFPSNPSGSVLMPSPEPYNKLEKMKEANLLLATEKTVEKASITKVNFAQKKTIFLYNGEDYSFQACTFPSEEETKDVPVKRKSANYAEVIGEGNETKILVVKMPNTESEEPSSITDEFENDDVCIPMCSICTPEIMDEKVQEQVTNILPEENNINLQEDQNLQDILDEHVQGNNQDEESELAVKNNSGVLIKITGADSFESDVTDFRDQDEIEEEENAVLQEHNLNNECETNNTQMSKCIDLPNVEENLIVLKKQSKHVKKSNNKMYITCSTDEIKNKCNVNNKKMYKNLDQTEIKYVSFRKTNTFKKSKSIAKKSKSIEIDITPNCSVECSSHKNVERPKSCVERKKSEKRPTRPFTAPIQRTCCQWGQPRLPEYNGLRSEYGLSAEQLRERKRAKIENSKARQVRKENKIKEEEEKRKENEARFCAWLEKKREQAHRRYLRNQHMFLEANSITTYPAPTSHLKKMGSLRSKRISKIHRNCISLEEVLLNVKPQEEKSYKIYLGVSVD